MNLIQQPPRSRCCGQACVAMVVDKPLADVIKVFGKRGGTDHRDVMAALEHYGRKPELREYTTAADTAILKYQQGRWGHWVVYHNGKIYDPVAGVYDGLPPWMREAEAVLLACIRT